jgi:hypothetical protein
MRGYLYNGGGKISAIDDMKSMENLIMILNESSNQLITSSIFPMMNICEKLVLISLSQDIDPSINRYFV